MNLQDVLIKTLAVKAFLKAEDSYKFPIKINDISLAIYSQDKIDITYQTTATKPECQIRSVLINGKHKAKIIYNPSLNQCWTRFSICKELCHVLIDTEESATQDIVQLISLIVGEPPHEITESYSEYKSYISEALAEYGALELLFPIEHRNMIRKKIDDGRYKKTNYQIATEYKIPEHYISLGLNPAYLDVINKVYDNLSDRE